MRKVSTGDRLRAAAALGLGELRGAYDRRKKAIELKAEQERAKAKTALERERIKAVKVKEMADLESDLYKAILAGQQAQAKAKQLRQSAGVYTSGERFGKVARGVGGILS